MHLSSILLLSFTVPLVILRSNLLCLRSTMLMVLQLSHLRGNMHLYRGICTFLYAQCIAPHSLMGYPPSCYWFPFMSRPCVFHSENTSQNSVNVAEVLSKCSIKESEKPQPDQDYGIPMTRAPRQVPQRVQGKNPLANMS